MKIELLVGSADFWARLHADIADAHESVYVQTFTFEGDTVGSALGRALEASAARDRRLLVDGYSLLYHNDRLITGPAWLEEGFRDEVRSTHRWMRRLRRAGTDARFGNPIGPWPVRLVRRNHKKLALVDDRVCYLGGINFSEHNFEWHDMMFRIESEELGRVLGDDFRASFAGRPAPVDRTVGPLRVIGLNGRRNPQTLAPLLDAIRSARSTVDVASAYLSHPFTGLLGEARRRGVRVRILTPERNNKANLARHVLDEGHRHDLEVYRYAGGMSHLKAMLIDEELLVAGSTNFDFMSYNILEEFILMTRDTSAVTAFLDRVWNPDLAAARRVTPRPSLGTRGGHTAVRIGSALAYALAAR